MENKVEELLQNPENFDITVVDVLNGARGLIHAAECHMTNEEMIDLYKADDLIKKAIEILNKAGNK